MAVSLSRAGGPWALVLAVLGGAAWGLCFGPEAVTIAPWMALVPLFLLLGAGRRQAVWLAYVHGVAFWLTSMSWIAPTMETYGQLPSWLAVVMWILLGLYLGTFTGVFGWLGEPLWRRGGWPALAGLPALWVAVEWLRAHYLMNGFPWNLAAYAWTEMPGALPLAAWSGAYGVSFVLAIANVAIALMLVHRHWRTGVVSLLGCFLLLAAAGRFGTDAHEPRVPGLPVRLLQPNITNLVTWDEELVRQNYSRVLEMSRKACDLPGALVVWPESAAWPFSYDRDARLREDLETLVAAGCPILFNSTTEKEGFFYNSVLLLGPKGLAGRYHKRHLVPFGEYVPMGRWVPFLDKLARNAGNFRPGRELLLLPWRQELLGAAVCFEVVFPFEVADAVQQGATLLVTVTNDAWYGDTAAPWQHYRAARFRAAESRRYLMRAAITGVSALIAPDGSVVSELGVGEEGVIGGEVVARRDLSPYTRAPWLIPLLCVLLAGFAILRSRGARRS
ncbi:MAG: apolipoprotein N-acyltransferase [Acidobacteria bacterium]|nr:MAG: apolipoprotein N-acyltransferase [Acidobacteriota bacterium]